MWKYSLKVGSYNFSEASQTEVIHFFKWEAILKERTEIQVHLCIMTYPKVSWPSEKWFGYFFDIKKNKKKTKKKHTLTKSEVASYSTLALYTRNHKNKKQKNWEMITNYAKVTQ